MAKKTSRPLVTEDERLQMLLRDALAHRVQEFVYEHQQISGHSILTALLDAVEESAMHFDYRVEVDR